MEARVSRLWNSSREVNCVYVSCPDVERLGLLQARQTSDLFAPRQLCLHLRYPQSPSPNNLLALCLSSRNYSMQHSLL